MPNVFFGGHFNDLQFLYKRHEEKGSASIVLKLPEIQDMKTSFLLLSLTVALWNVPASVSAGNFGAPIFKVQDELKNDGLDPRDLAFLHYQHILALRER